MDIQQFTEEILISDLRKGIRDVMDDRVELYANNLGSPFMLVTLLEEEFGLDKSCGFDDVNHNGWQADMWVTVTIDERKYTIAGSGYMGGVEFSKDDEDDF